MEWRGTAGDQHHQLREGPASPVSGREGETSHHLLEVSTISFHQSLNEMDWIDLLIDEGRRQNGIN